MIELLVIGATITIAAWATGASAHRRNAASRALDRYAQSRSYVFVPPPAKPRGASPRVLGAKDGVSLVFDLYRLNKDGDIRTRVLTVVERGSPPILSVTQRSGFTLSRAAATATLAGSAKFDHAYVIAKGASEDVEGLKTALGPLLLLAEHRHAVWLSSDRNKVSVSWHGMESDPLLLDAARDAVATIAKYHRPESPYR